MWSGIGTTGRTAQRQLTANLVGPLLRLTIGIQTRPIGAPWVVDRDGTVYKTFDDREWIYHLGIKNTNGKYDKASVGIEIANEVDLQLDGDKLYAFGKITPNTNTLANTLTRNGAKASIGLALMNRKSMLLSNSL